MSYSVNDDGIFGGWDMLSDLTNDDGNGYDSFFYNGFSGRFVTMIDKLYNDVLDI